MNRSFFPVVFILVASGLIYSFGQAINNTQVSGLGTASTYASTNFLAATNSYAPLASPVFTGVVTVPRITGATGTPTIAAGTGAGTGSPTVTVAGTDLGGNITVTTGTALTPVASGTVATLSFFNSSYGSAPNCVILTPANSATALLGTVTCCFVNTPTSTGFPITAGTTALVGATTYKWYYNCVW